MIRRYLIPRLAWGTWCGASTANPFDLKEHVSGFSVSFEWLGLSLEIGLGTVRRVKR